MRIRVVRNDLDDLASDMREIGTNAKPKLSAVVRRNTREGNEIAKTIAQGKVGIHGLNYPKRFSSEMTGPLTGEYGPTGTPKTEFVGAGWRHGVNTDLPQSADVIGPKFGDDVLDEADGWFW